MKKALFLAVGAALASPAFAQSSVQLYGIVDLAYRHTTNEGTADSGSHKGSLTRMIGGGMSQSRLGINVTEDMGNGVKALANLEQRINAQDGSVAGPSAASPSGFQQSWVGLQSSSLGRLTLGRQYNVLFDLVTSTYASYPYSPYMDAYKPEIGMALGVRANSMLKYTVELGPVRGALQYSRSEGSPTGGATKGGYVRYAQSGFAGGVGYQDYEFGSGKKIKAWTAGGSYRTARGTSTWATARTRWTLAGPRSTWRCWRRTASRSTPSGRRGSASCARRPAICCSRPPTSPAPGNESSPP